MKAGIIGRHCARIARTLNVVLPAHRVDACAFAPEVAGHQREIAKALHIIHAANMLGDAQRVINRAAIRAAVPTRGLLDVGGIELGDFSGPLGGKGFQVLKKFIGAFRAFDDERVVH